jgi:hypothetical protein
MSDISYSYDASRDDLSNKRSIAVNDAVNVLPFAGSPESGIWLDYKGRHHFVNLYKRMFEKVKQMGYGDIDNGDENIEDYYSENRFPDGTKGEIHCWWRAKKKADNSAFTYRIHIFFFCLLIKDETVVINGKKVKINTGEVNMFFTPMLENSAIKDVKKMNFLSDRMKDWWYQSIYKKHEEAAKLELFDDINELYGTAKKFLGMETYTKIRDDFHEEWNVPKEE